MSVSESLAPTEDDELEYKLLEKTYAHELIFNKEGLVTGGSLPAQAWHEFMLAAHEVVPVRPLPGGWKPPPPGAIVQDDGPAPVPTADVGARPATVSRQAARAPAQPPRPAPPQPVGGAQTVDADGFGMPAQDNAPTSSIGHPVPPGNVGGPSRKRHTTILDILSGG